jgi:hypothetical protein
MTRAWMAWVLVISLGALPLGGCKPKGDGAQPATPPKPQVDRDAGPGPAQGSVPAAPVAPDGGVVDGAPDAKAPAAGRPGILPDPAQYASTTEYAQAVSKFAQDIDTSKAPAFVTQMLAHMRKICELMKENINDCDGVAAAVKAYMEEHKDELLALKKQGDEAQAKMSPEEQAKLSAMTLMLMSPYAQDLAQAQLQFASTCPKQADQVAEIMQAFGD